MALDSEEIRKRQQRREEMNRRRKAEQKRVYMGLGAAAVVLIAAAVAIFLFSSGQPSQDPTQPSTVQSPQPTQAPTEAPTEPTQPPETVIRLAAVGDLNVTDKVVASGGSSYDYTEMLMDVAPLLADADVTAVNLEGILNGAPYGGEDCSAPQELMTALRRAGVDVVQLANSCSINGGLQGLSSTITGVKNAGMTGVGTFATAEDFRRSGGYTILEVQGLKVAFVAFTKGMDGMGLPAGSEDCVNLLYTDYATAYQKVDEDGITDVLDNVADEAPDVTIALLHWGSEYNEKISSSQREIRDLMLDRGVDVIIGSHAHFLQQIDFDAEAGTLVAYSLGDFLGDAARAGTHYSVVLNVEITRDNVTGVTKVTDFSYTPIYTDAGETGVRLLRIREAMFAYETGYIDAVSPEIYESMSYALERIEDRIHPDEEE